MQWNGFMRNRSFIFFLFTTCVFFSPVTAQFNKPLPDSEIFGLTGNVKAVHIYAWEPVKAPGNTIIPGKRLPLDNGAVRMPKEPLELDESKKGTADKLFFNENGMLVEKWVFSPLDTNDYFINYYTYNDWGGVVMDKSVSSNKPRDFSIRIEKEYDSLRRLREERVYQYGWNNLIDRYEYHYENQGQTVKIFAYTKGLGLRQWYEKKYDANGWLLESFIYEKDSSLYTRMPGPKKKLKTAADSLTQKRLVETERKKGNYIKTDLDNAGNWIKLVIYRNGRVEELYTRSIEYYTR